VEIYWQAIIKMSGTYTLRKTCDRKPVSITVKKDVPITYRGRIYKNPFKNAAATCPLCGTEDEDLRHFILVCTKLSRIRKRHLQKIEDYLEKIHKGFYIRNVNENALLQVIIDY
jgi:hypothetical protein